MLLQGSPVPKHFSEPPVYILLTALARTEPQINFLYYFQIVVYEKVSFEQVV